MDHKSLSPASRQVEALLDSPEKNPLLDFVREESLRQVEASNAVPSDYDIYAIRRNDRLGNEVFGPKRLFVGNYSDEVLYGAAASPIARFRSAIGGLRVRAEKTASLNPEEVEYGHQAALLWSEIGRLKDFIGTSPVISEIVAEFRTARFQFIGRDTPPTSIQAVASALRLVIEAKRFDTTLVDHVVDTLGEGGIDSLAPDVLRESSG